MHKQLSSFSHSSLFLFLFSVCLSFVPPPSPASLFSSFSHFFVIRVRPRFSNTFCRTIYNMKEVKSGLTTGLDMMIDTWLTWMSNLVENRWVLDLFLIIVWLDFGTDVRRLHEQRRLHFFCCCFTVLGTFFKAGN